MQQRLTVDSQMAALLKHIRMLNHTVPFQGCIH